MFAGEGLDFFQQPIQLAPIPFRSYPTIYLSRGFYDYGRSRPPLPVDHIDHGDVTYDESGLSVINEKQKERDREREKKSHVV